LNLGFEFVNLGFLEKMIRFSSITRRRKLRMESSMSTAHLSLDQNIVAYDIPNLNILNLGFEFVNLGFLEKNDSLLLYNTPS
jgi:hypothetical protein